MITSIVESFIDKVSNLRVVVIGETIIDEFVPVTYEGPSMKSLCPALKIAGKKEVHHGGAAAIANHLKDFVKQVHLVSNPPGEIIKTRYVDMNDGRKHVEINHFSLSEHANFINSSDYDVVIIADFGHGFCDAFEITGEFHLMCQTNSNNFGFNRISKWKNYKKKTVCIDLREASLQMNRKASFADLSEVNELYNYELNAEHLFITLGSEGALHYNGSQIKRHHSFKSTIVDTIGAGDTFFAFISLASTIQDNENILKVPSLAASLSTTWQGNKKSVTKQNLLAYATQFV
ncbi:PfkB family carbohydrate kinase [Haliscomenobacter sp.]|uniref:PfkB family carbohydrate kinase n=1 Tax=Haliscomenobacter sp. TaxID=2717303 RepID=UPI003BAD7643